MSTPRRVYERRRAVALARHYRKAEGLRLAQIAERLGRKPATVKSYFYDPDGAKARALKRSYRGRCEGCGAPTSAGSGPGSARSRCVRCRGLQMRKWSPSLIEEALRAWHARYGRPPTSTDLSRTYAERHGGERLRRLDEGWDGHPWPALGVVQHHFRTFTNAKRAVFGDLAAARRVTAGHTS